MNFFSTDNKNAYESQKAAYWIAYSPIIFQVSRSLINSKILSTISLNKKAGESIENLAAKLNLSNYQVRVLLHAGLGIGLVYHKEDLFFLTKTSLFLINEKAAKVTMDFVNDVCYQGMYHLEESFANSRPEGLKTFGNWNTIYDGLFQLPDKVKESWLNLDHFFSDNAFPAVLPFLSKSSPERLLDIGGNTGKFAKYLLSSLSNIHVGILDLPPQIVKAKLNLTEVSSADISFYENNILDTGTKIPEGFDHIWMSQFLDCFSEDEIVVILKKCFIALPAGGKIFIIESFWDKQRFDTSAFCLQQFSLYFTAMANGNSQMYDYKTFIACVKRAGLKVIEEYHDISMSNSLLILQKQDVQ